MKYTSTYLLNKPEETDRIQISDINENMDTIDANLKSLVTALGNKVDGTASNLKTYSSLDQFGATLTMTMTQVCALLPDESYLSFDSASATTNLKPTSFGECLTTIVKSSSQRMQILCTMKTGGLAFGALNSDGSFNQWSVVCGDSAFVGYGTCSTAIGTAGKTVTISNFTLAVGALVTVAFTNGNTSTVSTLNVNGTGAKEIWLNGARLDGITILAGNIVQMVYDGTYYRIISIDKATSAAQKPTLEAASWEEIIDIAACGLAAEYWSIGDTKEMALSTGENVRVRIEGFKHDECVDGSRAAITFALESPLRDQTVLNASSSNAGGWEGCTMRVSTLPGILLQLPEELQANIKTVKKITSTGGASPTLVEIQDKLWLFSMTEIGLTTTTFALSGEGTAYSTYTSDISRKKATIGGTTTWYTRSSSTSSTAQYAYVSTTGVATSGTPASSNQRTVFGFCI